MLLALLGLSCGVVVVAEEEHVALGLGGHGGPSDAQEHGGAHQQSGRGAGAARGEQEVSLLRRLALYQAPACTIHH